MMAVVCLSVRPMPDLKCRTERHIKLKIDKMEAHDMTDPLRGKGQGL